MARGELPKRIAAACSMRLRWSSFHYCGCRMGERSREPTFQSAGGRIMVWFVVAALAVLLVGLAIVAHAFSEAPR